MKVNFQTIIRRALLVTLFCLTMNVMIEAQPAKGINYQAVLRDSRDSVLKNADIKVVLSITEAEINGKLIWKEEHTGVKTNQFGLFNVSIGKGSKVSGSETGFSKIKWGQNEHWLKVEIAIGSGQLINFGATQMLSVPYALYADSARVARADFSGVTFDPVSNTLKNSNSVIADLTPLRQNLEYDPTTYHLSISGKPGIIDLRQFAHAPQDIRILNNKLWVTGNKDSTVVDLSPYKQSLSVSATSKLLISGGNEVQVDTSNVNEIQTLSLNGNKIGLSKLGGEVTIDASETNELQELLISNNKISLSKSITRAVPIDTNNVNELQDISLTGNLLKISNSASSVDLSKYLDDTDKQTLDRSGNNLIISGGNQVDVSDMINLPWVGFSGNNLAGQPLPASAETLITWNEELDSGTVFDNTAFTAPANGIYNLSFTLILQGNLEIKIYKDNNPIPIRAFEGFGNSISHTMLLNLVSGEKISIKARNISGTTTSYVTTGYFSGFRVK